jgi:hypothetical protein
MTLTTATSSITSYLYRRKERVKEHVEQKKSPSGWVLPKQHSTFADEGSWSNVDSGVTPLDQRTWSTWTILGFWFSDGLNAQGWEGAASIIAVGLTWSAFPAINFLISFCCGTRRWLWLPRLTFCIGERRSTFSSSDIRWILFPWCSTERLAPIFMSTLPWLRAPPSVSTFHE